MRKTALTLIMAGSLATAMAPAAFAAADSQSQSMDPGEAKALCSRLSEQFNGLKPFKQGLPYWKDAKSEFSQGRQDCANGNPVKGAKAMQSAISDLYVKPDTL